MDFIQKNVYGKKVNVKKPGLRFVVCQFILEMSDVSILTAHTEHAVSNWNIENIILSLLLFLM